MTAAFRPPEPKYNPKYRFCQLQREHPHRKLTPLQKETSFPEVGSTFASRGVAEVAQVVQLLRGGTRRHTPKVCFASRRIVKSAEEMA